MADPEFIADAKRGGIEISALGGKEIAKLVDEVATTPDSVVDRLSQTIAAGLKQP